MYGLYTLNIGQSVCCCLTWHNVHLFCSCMRIINSFQSYLLVTMVLLKAFKIPLTASLMDFLALNNMQQALEHHCISSRTDNISIKILWRPFYTKHCWSNKQWSLVTGVFDLPNLNISGYNDDQISPKKALTIKHGAFVEPCVCAWKPCMDKQKRKNKYIRRTNHNNIVKCVFSCYNTNKYV